MTRRAMTICGMELRGVWETSATSRSPLGRLCNQRSTTLTTRTLGLCLSRDSARKHARVFPAAGGPVTGPLSSARTRDDDDERSARYRARPQRKIHFSIVHTYTDTLSLFLSLSLFYSAPHAALTVMYAKHAKAHCNPTPPPVVPPHLHIYPKTVESSLKRSKH